VHQIASSLLHLLYYCKLFLKTSLQARGAIASSRLLSDMIHTPSRVSSLIKQLWVTIREKITSKRLDRARACALARCDAQPYLVQILFDRAMWLRRETDYARLVRRTNEKAEVEGGGLWSAATKEQRKTIARRTSRTRAEAASAGLRADSESNLYDAPTRVRRCVFSLACHGKWRMAVDFALGDERRGNNWAKVPNPARLFSLKALNVGCAISRSHLRGHASCAQVRPFERNLCIRFGPT